MSYKKIGIGIVGLGTVGAGLIEIIRKKKNLYKNKYSIDFSINGISAKNNNITPDSKRVIFLPLSSNSIAGILLFGEIFKNFSKNCSPLFISTLMRLYFNLSSSKRIETFRALGVGQ